MLYFAHVKFKQSALKLINIPLCVDIDMGNTECGSPLLQLIAYAQIKKLEEGEKEAKIDKSIVELFIKKGAQLSRVIRARGCNNSTALVFAINHQRLDIIQLLIDNGVDPILCGDGDVSSLFTEYAHLSSHKFIQWLLNERIPESEIQSFINRILETQVLIRDTTKRRMNCKFYKAPAHAFLLCGHKLFIECLVEKKPELVKEVDPFGRTALHLAAEEGDLDSVKILLSW